MIKWDEIYKLSPSEFSEDPDIYAEEKLIYSLSDLRKLTGKSMRPSPVSGALARFSGSKTTQHYVGPKNALIRKSTGSDIFCEGFPFFIYSIILASSLFKGIGVYLDTTGPDGLPWVMFHVDLRKKGFKKTLPLIWVVEKVYSKTKKKKINKYRYPQVKPYYWELFNDERLFQEKQFGIKSA